jgi:carbamoyl-phosphate synthase large subunit
MNNKWIICLGAGDSQVSLIKNAQFLGYKVLAIDKNSRAPGFNLADESIVESTHNSDNIIDKIKGRKWHGLLARCTGRALFTAANIVKEFKVLGVNYDLANIATSKSALHKFSLDNNIRVPYGVKVSSIEEFNNNEFTDQIIVKPDFTIVGKKSITKVRSSNKHEVNNAIELALLSSGNEFVEIEDFIEGYDCSYLSWMENGVSSILLTWDELIGFDESFNLFQFGISTPSISVAINQSKKIEKVIENFAKLFPDVRTLLSFSFRVDTKGIPWLIEVHADMTGDLILDKLAPVATDCDFLLEITRLFIKGESSLDLNFNNDITAKPTALLYKNITDNSVNDLVLSSDDIYSLHNKINNLIKDTILEQKRFLDQEEKL